MTFTYPAVFTPHKDGKGYHVAFPDLECCEADGPDLEDALDEARDAAYNWLMVELEDGGEFPEQSHVEDIQKELPEGCFVRQMMIRIKLLPDSD
ncbi:MAG: type II toxin-antitoxin system HicB family antitoxin [Clostridiales bacterium]|nr:type II toxin-antitoxin system HicB family antitoxin [Clostridiales bacterium]